MSDIPERCQFRSQMLHGLRMRDVHEQKRRIEERMTDSSPHSSLGREQSMPRVFRVNGTAKRFLGWLFVVDGVKLTEQPR